jgi:hypothetical protein
MLLEMYVFRGRERNSRGRVEVERRGRKSKRRERREGGERAGQSVLM